VDVIVRLLDGAWHEVDSSEMAFKVAGSMAIKEAVMRGHPVLLEPVMDIEAVTPEEYLGAVQGNISARRGQISSLDLRPGGAQAVRAIVPSLRCSVMPQICGVCHRDVPISRWNLRGMSEFLTNWPRVLLGVKLLSIGRLPSAVR